MMLTDLNKSIESREDFIRFVKALNNDLRNNPESWENQTLERFLEAVGAWTEALDGYYSNKGIPVPEQPDWKAFGDILLAAKFYE